MKTDEIVDKITLVRSKNNILWMEILKIAVKTPEGKKLIEQVTRNDQEISELTKQLGSCVSEDRDNGVLK